MYPPSDDATTAPEDRWLTPRFLLVLVTQACFSLGWSTFFLVPKYLAVRFGLGAGAIGPLAVLPAVGAVVMVPFVGYALDRYGRRPFVSLGSTMVAVAALGFSAVTEIGPAIAALQLLQGVGFVFAWNAAATIATDLVPSKRVGRAIGIFGAANLSMNALAPYFGERLADAYGWHVPFLLASSSCTLAAVLGSRLPVVARLALRPTLGAIGLAMRSGPMVRVFVATALFAVGFTSVFAFHAPYALLGGITEVGDFFLGFTMTALVVRLGLGGVVDRFGARRVSTLALVAYAAAPLSLFVLGPSRLIFVGAVLGSAHGMLFPAIMALAVERSGAAYRGMAMSLVHGAFNGGSVVTGFVLGALVERYGYELAFAIAAAVTLAGAFVVAGGRVVARVDPPVDAGAAGQGGRVC